MNRVKNGKQQGYGLIEVMVALFVLSIGLLGVAGLQLQGIRGGYTATLRTQAVMQTVEIIERMRANPPAVNDGRDAVIYNSLVSDLGQNHGCEKIGTTASNLCTAQQMAEHDIWAWKQNLDEVFPNMTPTASIVGIGFVPDDPKMNKPTTTNFVVTINWIERGVAKTYSTQTQIMGSKRKAPGAAP